MGICDLQFDFTDYLREYSLTEELKFKWIKDKRPVDPGV